MYAEELHSTTSSVTLERTDRAGSRERPTPAAEKDTVIGFETIEHFTCRSEE